jgi:asparagine synthase (glutamine-hydrolysing)
MCQEIKHRGPDGEGTFTTTHAGLGSRRLAIIDRSLSSQPIFNENQTISAVFNGEIYNYQSLRASLQRRGHVFRTEGDGEVIVHAYEEYNEECVLHLEGMFAFAIWDDRVQQGLIARDRFGQKPLLYTYDSERLVFASEFKAIFAYPGIVRQPNHSALWQFLSLSYICSPLTAYDNVYKLPPGHILRWICGDLELKPYWFPKYEPKLNLNPAAVQSELRRRLSEAVARRMVSEVPVGVFLSGGIDSSTIAALMQQRSSAPIHTFSVGFDDSDYNELRYARIVAETIGTIHAEEILNVSLVDTTKFLIKHYGEPFADSSALPTYHLAQFARNTVGVVLTGDGADELFGGYVRHGEALRDPDPLATNIGIMSIFQADSKEQILSEDMLRIVNDEKTEAQLLNIMKSELCSHQLDQILSLDVKTYLADDILVKVDVATMANGLEARCPFLDHQFAEWVMRLPIMQKHSGQISKVALRGLARNLLPEAIAERPKMGFSVPLSRWFRKHLQELLIDTVCSSRFRERGYLNVAVVERLVKEHLSGERDHRNRLWALLILELWFQEWID